MVLTSTFQGQCNTKVKLVTWEITYTTKAVRKFYPIMKKEKVTNGNSSKHRIILHFLRMSELIYVRCKVDMIHSQGAIGYDYGFLKLAIPDLIPNITGKRKVTRNEVIVLNASGSEDPAYWGTLGMRFMWRCKRVKPEKRASNRKRTFDCNSVLPANKKGRLKALQVDSSQFDPGIYTFTLTLTRRDRRKSTQFNVTIVPTAILKIR